MPACSTSTVPRNCWAARGPCTKKLFLFQLLAWGQPRATASFGWSQTGKSLDSWTASQESECGWHGLPFLSSFLISDLSQNRGSREARPCWETPLRCKPDRWQDTILLESGSALGGTAAAGCPCIFWGLEGLPGQAGLLSTNGCWKGLAPGLSAASTLLHRDAKLPAQALLLSLLSLCLPRHATHVNICSSQPPLLWLRQ